MIFLERQRIKQKIYKTTITITELEKSHNNSDSLHFKYANERRARKKNAKNSEKSQRKIQNKQYLIYAFNFFLSFNFHSFPFSRTYSPNEIWYVEIHISVSCLVEHKSILWLWKVQQITILFIKFEFIVALLVFRTLWLTQKWHKIQNCFMYVRHF